MERRSKSNILGAALNLPCGKCSVISTHSSISTRVTHLLAVGKFIADGPGLDPWSGGYIPGKGQAGGGPLNQSHRGNLGGL